MTEGQHVTVPRFALDVAPGNVVKHGGDWEWVKSVDREGATVTLWFARGSATLPADAQVMAQAWRAQGE